MTTARDRLELPAMDGLYRRLGVASTFSPRFLPVLAEASRAARRGGAEFCVIHAAGETPQGAQEFRRAFASIGRPADTPILWSAAETPADGILSACASGDIDLLVAGAMEREVEHRNFVGGVARELLQRAGCDLLLVPQPREEEVPCRRVAVAVDLNEPSVGLLNRACRIATAFGAEEMVFLGVVTPFDEARASAIGEFEAPDEDRLMSIVDCAEGFEGEVDCQLLRSTTGFAICDFVQQSEVDLLIGAASRGDGLRFHPTHLDWLLQVIPSNVLVLSAPLAD